MQQVLIGGVLDPLSASTAYSHVVGPQDFGSPETFMHQVIAADGVLKNFYVELSAAPGIGEDRDFYARVNGSVVGCPHVHIHDLDASGSDLVTEFAVSAGDIVSIMADTAGDPTAATAKWSVMFEGTTANESLILGNVNDALLPSNTGYTEIMGGNTWSVNASNHYQVIPTNGSISDLYISLTSDPGVPPAGYKFTLMIGEVAQTLTCTVTANDTTANDTVHSVVVAPGDKVSLRSEPQNGPGVAPIASWGMKFTSTINGESIILGGTTDNLSNGTVEYNYPTCGLDGFMWNGTEAEITALAQACIMKKLYVELIAAPGGVAVYTFTSRVAGGAGNLSVAITGIATTGNDTVNTDTLVAGNEFHMCVTPTGSPNVTDAWWGLVSYIDPAASSPSASSQGAYFARSAAWRGSGL